MELTICQILFYVLAFLAIVFGCAVVAFRNPVSSAMGMALCFGFTAAILFGLGAQFLGIVQLIVYAGAILVLFLFVVMMLDVKDEERKSPCFGVSLAGTVVAGLLAGIIAHVAINLPGGKDGECPCVLLCDNIGDLAIGQSAAAEETPAPVQDSCDPASFGGPLPQLSDEALNNDTKLIGATLFTKYNIQLVILAFALLAGTVGSIALARKIRKD